MSGPALDSRSPTLDYGLALFFLASGLMSKAMLVTWPFVMLLLDYWPLGRMQNAEAGDTHHRSSGAALRRVDATRSTPDVSRCTLHAPGSTLLRLVGEKIPFLVLSVLSCVLTYLTEGGRRGEVGFEGIPALLRVENAFMAYTRLSRQDLLACQAGNALDAARSLVLAGGGGSGVVVVGLCVVVLWLGRRWPCLLVGWGWFMGTLIPVIGLTKGWGAFMADRFTYVSSVGVLILVIGVRMN